MTDIAKGDKNNKIKELQRALIRIGYPLDRWGADGQVGSETLGAIAQFCDDKGLQETDLDSGIVRGWIVETILKEAEEKKVKQSHPLIEDVRYDEYQKWTRRNKVKNIDTICLHQMAVKDSDDKGWHRWRRLAIHWVVTCGKWSKAYQLHDFDLRLPHGHGWNNRSVGFEFEGYFSGIGTEERYFWKPKSRPNRKPMVPTDEQIEAGRAAVRLTVEEIAKMGGEIKFIGAHRQSYGMKSSDPGSLIWQGVAIPMIEELGLKEAPTLNHHKYPGKPIPEAWNPENKGVKY
jgi:hypothetical protein